MKKQIDFSSIELDGIDHRDYPDYCDAFICYAEYTDSTPLNDDELELIELRFFEQRPFKEVGEILEQVMVRMCSRIKEREITIRHP